MVGSFRGCVYLKSRLVFQWRNLLKKLLACLDGKQPPPCFLAQLKLVNIIHKFMLIRFAPKKDAPGINFIVVETGTRTRFRDIADGFKFDPLETGGIKKPQIAIECFV